MFFVTRAAGHRSDSVAPRPVAIVFDLPEQLCYERYRARPGRAVAPHMIRRQAEQLRRSLPGLAGEGFSRVFVLSSSEEVDAAIVRREPL